MTCARAGVTRRAGAAAARAGAIRISIRPISIEIGASAGADGRGADGAVRRPGAAAVGRDGAGRARGGA
ncbi:MAG TPA: hypothetical protein VNT54_18100, partial [Solirubrobacteraceae bacterium]|nr:hypothetical protein [Solirubrobacteraceae bacterium]